MGCTPRDASVCGEVKRIRSYWLGVGTCPDDFTCEITGPQTCVICGNGEVDSMQEECDDGDTEGGDGCSSQCKYERHCMNQYGETSCGCITLPDCGLCAECMDDLVCNECS
jgi:cysteine-rich repeat protein